MRVVAYHLNQFSDDNPFQLDAIRIETKVVPVLSKFRVSTNVCFVGESIFSKCPLNCPQKATASFLLLGVVSIL